MAMYQIKSWLTGAVLFGCDVPDAHSGMAARFALEKATQSRADLSRANLCGADLCGAYLSGANLCGAYLYGANLCGANLCGANLSRANLSGADLSGANLYGANLCGANLSRADLSRANLCGAYLYGANLYGANLYGADLSRAKIDGEEIKKPPVQIGGLAWDVLITEGFMRIGCQRHTHEAWAEFGPDEIHDMAGNATEFWEQWKAILLSICKEHSIDKN